MNVYKVTAVIDFHESVSRIVVALSEQEAHRSFCQQVCRYYPPHDPDMIASYPYTTVEVGEDKMHDTLWQVHFDSLDLIICIYADSYVNVIDKVDDACCDYAVDPSLITRVIKV
jgi:hypothetical protein